MASFMAVPSITIFLVLIFFYFGLLMYSRNTGGGVSEDKSVSTAWRLLTVFLSKASVSGFRYPRSRASLSDKVNRMEPLFQEKPFSCSECDKSFVKAYNLKEHVRCHTGEKPYGCTECETRFASSSNLKVHMRTHTGEKPYQCMTCGKSFSTSGYLEYHVRIHSGEKPNWSDSLVLLPAHNKAVGGPHMCS